MELDPVDDAVDALDTPRPLTYRELREICTILYAAGKKAGVTQTVNRIQRTANLIEASDAATETRPQQRFVSFLWDLSRVLETADETKEAVQEYQDPTRAIRERLTETARKRDGRL